VLARSDAKQDEPRESGGAPEDREEDRRRGSGSGSPSASRSTRDACREAALRQGISRWLVEVFEKDQREMGEGSWGYLRAWST
jgi:hypothetical protein